VPPVDLHRTHTLEDVSRTERRAGGQVHLRDTRNFAHEVFRQAMKDQLRHPHNRSLFDKWNDPSQSDISSLFDPEFFFLTQPRVLAKLTPVGLLNSEFCDLISFFESRDI